MTKYVSKKIKKATRKGCIYPEEIQQEIIKIKKCENNYINFNKILTFCINSNYYLFLCYALLITICISLVLLLLLLLNIFYNYSLLKWNCLKG